MCYSGMEIWIEFKVSIGLIPISLVCEDNWSSILTAMEHGFPIFLINLICNEAMEQRDLATYLRKHFPLLSGELVLHFATFYTTQLQYKKGGGGETAQETFKKITCAIGLNLQALVSLGYSICSLACDRSASPCCSTALNYEFSLYGYIGGVMVIKREMELYHHAIQGIK